MSPVNISRMKSNRIVVFDAITGLTAEREIWRARRDAASFYDGAAGLVNAFLKNQDWNSPRS
jgi:hypothetical protein